MMVSISAECLYSTQVQLVKCLKKLCASPKYARTDKFKVNIITETNYL